MPAASADTGDVTAKDRISVRASKGPTTSADNGDVEAKDSVSVRAS